MSGPERIWHTTDRRGKIAKHPDAHVKPCAEVMSAYSEYVRTDIAATEADALRADNERLRSALERTAYVLTVMPDIAMKVGLEGTSQWDEIAGAPDLYGALDQACAALADAEPEYEICERCGGSGHTLDDSGEPGLCKRCHGDTVQLAEAKT